MTENQAWYDGQAVLADGKVLDGDFNYNFITGTLIHRLDDKSTPYSARSIRSFVLALDSLTVKRYFSLPYESDKPNVKQPTFFELVYQKKNIALLSRHGYDFKRRAVDATNINGVFFMPSGTQTQEIITEFLYLADEKGNIYEYAKAKKDKFQTFQYDLAFGEVDESAEESYSRSNTNRSPDLKYKIINRNAIRELTHPRYEVLKKFIRDKKLSLNTIEELEILFDYYISIN